MRHEERYRVLETLKDNLDAGTTADAGRVLCAPVEEFVGEERLALEQEVLFKQTPLLLGLSSDLPDARSYLATNEAGVPILMTRDEAGAFRAFLNVCQHRGAQVVPEGRGIAGRFSCPFHAWTYHNTGDLIAVTREGQFGEVDRSELGLRELPACEVAGLLWVKPTPGDPLDPEALLGPLQDEMEHWQFRTHDFREEQVLISDINWKLAVDTFGENYHFNVLHQNTLANDIIGNLQTHDVFDQHYRMVFASKTGFNHVINEGWPIQDWPYRMLTLNVYYIFPNVILLVDPAGVDLLRMYPDDNRPGRSRTHHRYYPNPEIADEITESRFQGFNEIIVNEDYAVAASIQRNIGSGAQQYHLFGRNEPALHHYHNVIRGALNLPGLVTAEGGNS